MNFAYFSLQNAIEKKINELDLNDFITLHGNVSNVNEFMSNANIYVHN